MHNVQLTVCTSANNLLCVRQLITCCAYVSHQLTVRTSANNLLFVRQLINLLCVRQLINLLCVRQLSTYCAYVS